jgi:hypothetical protein
LADEVAARLEAKSKPPTSAPMSERTPQPLHRVPAPAVNLTALDELIAVSSELAPELSPESTPMNAITPEQTSPSHATALMARLALGIFIIIVLINIPFNAQGTALARSIPSSASLVIANGLVVKEATSPDIYVYRDNAFHWITSLEAFEYFGYRWQDVHIVEPGFLNQFTKGKPIYVLLKCDASPNIYRLDAGHKRWIVDIPTFEAEGYVWQDVKFVSCNYLHNLPDGDSIPPGRGAPPPPLP